MAYVGASPANRALTSADIAPGSVTLNDINFTDTPTNMNITGVINKHTMRLAEGVTVTGDVTISDNLILSKISDDGVGITLTNDSSTRTITGSGSIEASTLAQTPNASLTGMTGTVGSGVTGSPNLNLGNATFPAGHVIQTKVKSISLATGSNSFCTAAPAGAAINVNSQNLEVTSFSATSGNHILVNYSCGSQDNTNSSNNGLLGLNIGGTKYPLIMCNTSKLSNATVTFAHTLGSALSNVTISAWLFAPNSANKCVYQHNYDTPNNAVWTISVQEIQA